MKSTASGAVPVAVGLGEKSVQIGDVFAPTVGVGVTVAVGTTVAVGATVTVAVGEGEAVVVGVGEAVSGHTVFSVIVILAGLAVAMMFSGPSRESAFVFVVSKAMIVGAVAAVAVNGLKVKVATFVTAPCTAFEMSPPVLTEMSAVPAAIFASLTIVEKVLLGSIWSN